MPHQVDFRYIVLALRDFLFHTPKVCAGDRQAGPRSGKKPLRRRVGSADSNRVKLNYPDRRHDIHVRGDYSGEDAFESVFSELNGISHVFPSKCHINLLIAMCAILAVVVGLAYIVNAQDSEDAEGWESMTTDDVKFVVVGAAMEMYLKKFISRPRPSQRL